MKFFIQKTIISAVALITLLSASLSFAEDRYDTVNKALAQAQAAAKQTISPRTAEDIHRALVLTMDYLGDVARLGQTDNLTLDQAELTVRHLGETFFVLLRHQGIDPEKYERDLTNPEKAFGVLKEMMYDAKQILTFRKDGYGNRTWGVTETIQKEKLTTDLTNQLSQFVDRTMQNMNAENIMKEDFYLKLNYLAERGLQLRHVREGSQKIARWVYLGLAVATFLHPPIDLVIERTYYSSFYSSLIYTSSFLSLFVIKTRMASTKTVEALMALAEMLKNPRETVQNILRTPMPDGMSCKKILN